MRIALLDRIHYDILYQMLAVLKVLQSVAYCTFEIFDFSAGLPQTAYAVIRSLKLEIENNSIHCFSKN